MNITNRFGGVIHRLCHFSCGLSARTACGIILTQWRDADYKGRKCKRCRKVKAFTFIEVLIVVAAAAVVGILFTLLFHSLQPPDPPTLTATPTAVGTYTGFASWQKVVIDGHTYLWAGSDRSSPIHHFGCPCMSNHTARAEAP